jgi:uncharacterized protein GlcG (DUF336 family)
MDLLTTAKTLTDRVEAEATQAKIPVSVCVLDVHGNLVLQHRMNGAPAFSMEISERKAYTSALVGVRTADLVPLVQPGQPLYPLLTVSGDATPPWVEACRSRGWGQSVAGVSGGTNEQDIAIVEEAALR